jgi:hypothetical protein
VGKFLICLSFSLLKQPILRMRCKESMLSSVTCVGSVSCNGMSLRAPFSGKADPELRIHSYSLASQDQHRCWIAREPRGACATINGGGCSSVGLHVSHEEHAQL